MLIIDYPPHGGKRMIRLNNRIMLIPVFVVMSLFYFSAYCFAGAWTSKQGGMYNKFALNYYYADQNYNENGDKEDFPLNGEFSDYNFQYYMEYGLTDDLTVITSLYYKYIKKEDDTILLKTWGVSDVDLGLKSKLLDTRAGVLSAQGLIKIPELYDANDPLPLGNGQYDFELRLLYGLSLMPKFPGYLNAEFGYRFRTEDPSDEWRYLLEFGMDLGKKAYARVKLDGIKSANNGRIASGTVENPTLTNNFDLGKLDMALGYKLLEKWSVEISYTPEIYGENTSAGRTCALALVYMFDGK